MHKKSTLHISSLIVVIICYLAMNSNHLRSKPGWPKCYCAEKKKTDNETSFWQKLQFRQLFLDKIIRIFKSNLNNIWEKKPRKKKIVLNIYTTPLPPGVIACKLDFLFLRGLSALCLPSNTDLYFFKWYMMFFGFISYIPFTKEKNYDKLVTVTRIFFHIS